MKNLYHYTSMFHLPQILASGYLKLTESNLLMPTSNENVLPMERTLYKPVVWLTSSIDPSGHGLISTYGVNKKEVRITIRDRKHYQPWLVWSRNNRINKSWAKKLELDRNPNSWFISESIISLSCEELLRIENTVSGEVLVDVTENKRKCIVKLKMPYGMNNKIFESYKAYAGWSISIGDVIKFEI